MELLEEENTTDTFNMWENYSQDLFAKINSGWIAKDKIQMKWNWFKWPSCPVSEIHWALFSIVVYFVDLKKSPFQVCSWGPN